MNIRHWLWQLLIAVDQLANVLVTPFHSGAWADETLSARAWRMERQGKPWGRIARPCIDVVMFWSPGHCRASYESERLRMQAPPEERGFRGAE